jgi:hypothetical protein
MESDAPKLTPRQIETEVHYKYRSAIKQKIFKETGTLDMYTYNVPICIEQLSLDKLYEPVLPDFVPYSDGDLDPISLEDIEEDPIDEVGTSQFEKPVTDHLIHAEVVLPKGEPMQMAWVIGRSKSDDGRILGIHDDNPMLNTLLYDVQFPDGLIKEYVANVISENMFSQVDAEGHSYALLEAIVDHKRDSTAVEHADKYIYTKSGTRRLKKTTAGWKLLIAWKDGSEQWIPLSIMKESNPVDVADIGKSL